VRWLSVCRYFFRSLNKDIKGRLTTRELHELTLAASLARLTELLTWELYSTANIGLGELPLT
jgi:hypothetical protein